jgi:hypothetical protein
MVDAKDAVMVESLAGLLAHSTVVEMADLKAESESKMVACWE